MSVAVKTRRIEKDIPHGVILRFRPQTPAKVIEHIEREYGSYMIDPDDELVVFNETDLARKIDKRMTPGKYLRNLREATGMTQKQVGEMTGKRSSYISDLETGQREIGKKVAKKLAEIFNVSPAVFI